MAWCSLGHDDRVLLEEPLFMELAEKYGKSTAQIILRWHTQMGNIVIPGSKNEAHMKDNIDIFDLTLTEEELAKIAALDKNKRYYEASEEALQGFLAFAPNVLDALKVGYRSIDTAQSYFNEEQVGCAIKFALDDADMTAVDALDKAENSFFSHQDPNMVEWFVKHGRREKEAA